jgi:hypothetical protein
MSVANLRVVRKSAARELKFKPMRLLTFIVAHLVLGLTVSVHGISDADKQGILEGGNFQYLKLGAIHMLTGYDHLLFLDSA